MRNRPEMSTADVLALASSSPTTNVPTASRAPGLSPNLGYELVPRGEFPCRVLKLGRKLRVPTADLLEALGIPHIAPRADASPETASTSQRAG
jgi:hypothetical protein